MPEDKKRSGCGCGGCLLFSLYSIIILLGGMFLSNLVGTSWDLSRAKDGLIKESTSIVYLIKDIATELITGEEQPKPQSSPSPTNTQKSPPKTLIGSANESYIKAMTLLKSAHKATGQERQKLLRELQAELQKALSKYQEAEAADNNNPELVKKISHISDLLDKMNP